jgi:hypothetical protein
LELLLLDWEKEERAGKKNDDQIDQPAYVIPDAKNRLVVIKKYA